MNIFVSKKTTMDSLLGTLIITIGLTILRLFRAIDWNWWWVFSPIITQICFGTLVLFIRDNARRLKGE